MIYYNHKARAKENNMNGLDIFREMIRQAKKHQTKHWVKGNISARQAKKNHKKGITLQELEETLIKTSEKEYRIYSKKRFNEEFKSFTEMTKYIKRAINRARSTT